MSDRHLYKTNDSITDPYGQRRQDQMTQDVVQQSQRYLSSNTKSCLVKGWKNQNKNIGVGTLPTIPKTETILLGSLKNLVVLHAEKLVSLVTNCFWYVPAEK